VLSDRESVTRRRSKGVKSARSNNHSRSADLNPARAQKWVHSEKVYPLFDLTLL
jgi:hypothetical protein